MGRVIRDIRRKIEGDEELQKALAVPLSKAPQIRNQKHRQRGLEALFLTRPRDRVHRQGQGA